MSFTKISAAAATLAFSAIASPLRAQVAAFVGSPSNGDVYVLDSTGVAAPVAVPSLTGIELLPIDCAGRTAVNSFAADRARFRDDIPGASRLELPNGRGSLYSYLRRVSNAEHYGYFVVNGAGQVRRLIESASSVSGLSPFVDRVAVSPDGAAILVGTRSFVGGDLLEISTVTGVVTSRTAQLPPQIFDGAGLALHGSWGAAVGTTTLLRFERAGGSQAATVWIANSDAPEYVARELVSTRNGDFCAGLGLDVNGASFPVVMGRTGLARRVGSGAFQSAGVGLAPDAEHGPWLTVSEDGQWCAWRTSNGGTYGFEAWLAQVPWQVASSTSLHVTQPALFDNYIDEIGDFFFNASGRLIMAAGDRSPSINGLEKSDIYAITPPPIGMLTSPGAPTVENLTVTSGETAPPFLYYGELVVERAFATPDGQSLYVVARDEGARTMFAIEANSPSPLVLEDEFTTLDYFDVAGTNMILAATYAAEPDNNGLAKVQAGVSTTLEDLHEFNLSMSFGHGLSRTDGQTIYVLSSVAGEQLWRSTAGGAPTRMTPRELSYGPTLAFTPAGHAACTVEFVSGVPIYVTWLTSGALRRMKSPVGPGFLLPGA